MRLTIARQDLARVLTNVGRVVEARNTIPILGSVMLTATTDRLQVTGTDLDIVATDASPADVETPGTICVDAKLLSDISKKVGGDISLELDGDRLQVKSGRSKFALQTLSAEDFPSFGEERYDAEFDIDLASLFAPVAFAISDESTRFYLNGIFLRGYDGKTVAVATDGHRLSRHFTGETAPFEGVIVPKKTVGILPKGVVKVAVSQQKIRIIAGDFVLVSKLIDGTFPNYEAVIPKSNDRVVTVDRDTFMTAADRVSTISGERGKAVKLCVDPGAIKLSVHNADQGDAEDEVEASYDGESMEVGFNASYVRDLLSVLPSGGVTLALRDGGSPVLVTGGAEGLTLILMPVRI